MKKKISAVSAVFAGTLAIIAALGGCAASKGLETEELKITVYKGVEVDAIEEPEEITDEDVDAAIQEILDEKAEEKDVTGRAVKEGDTVTIDYVGKIDGVEFDGGTASGYPLTIGSGSFIDGFEDSIIGHEIGDTFDWNGAFPDDYGNADYAGKEVVFTITVNAITEYEVPELDDEFVQEVSEESRTVDEYKKEMKKNLEENARQSYEDSLSSAAWTVVNENTEILKWPEDQVKEYADMLISQYEMVAEYNGMEFDEFIESQMGVTVEEFNQQAEDVAKQNIQQSMVAEAIAAEEGIEVDDEEYEERLAELAELYGYEDVEELKEAADEEDLREIILTIKVQDWLGENCIQTATE